MIRTLWVIGALFALPTAAQSQSYPVKPIRLVVPFAPGGGTDIIARLISQQLGEALGQPVVADNRGGAGSTLGTEIVAKAPADGYTLLLGNISLAFNATLYQKLSYDALRDLAPVTLVAVQPNILVIHPSVPAKTFKDFVAVARANPGKYTYASAGVGSGTHLAAELLKMLTKTDLVHVPYKGTGPALNDLIGGQVHMMVSTFASALPHAKSGRLRALAVTTAKRSNAAPEVPTLIESGVAGFEYSTWYGLLAPAGVRKDTVQKLNAVAKQVLARDDLKQKFEAQGVDALWNTPAEFSAYLKSETAKWAKVVKATGAKAE
ncbi:MAG TPA: tripartite tricarboxylate transporter substrate binding protein [Burkholderiales bacterium]|nr:tripartite tricarboxylate transporter substrate binding protein [Burkholderiales bacterium]